MNRYIVLSRFVDGDVFHYSKESMAFRYTFMPISKKTWVKVSR